MYFPKHRLRKIWLDKCLKSRVSQDPKKENMANGLRHCFNLNRYLLNTLNVGALGKVSLSKTQNAKTIS